MERFLLYLDDLEDAIFALALVGERIRRTLRALALMIIAVTVQVVVILLTLRDPAMGAAVASVLTVVALYRSATASLWWAPQTG